MPRPERSFRTPALILKRRDFNESDRLLTVVTPYHGKIDVIAKGARKPTGTRTGHVELFTRADMLIDAGRDLAILRQVEMVEPYLGLREDLDRGAAANYAAELVDRFLTQGVDDAAAIFKLLDQAFSRLCTSDDPRLVLRYFELHLLDKAGFKPELQTCVLGYEPILPIDQFFSYGDGGVVCVEHATRQAVLIPLPMLTLKMMRLMQRSTYESVHKMNLTPALLDDLERVQVGYITYLLEQRLQSVDFIRLLRRLPNL